MNATGRPAILYLVHRLPYPPDKGDRIRTFHILSYLSRRADVYLVGLADEPVSSEAAAALGRLCVQVAAVPLSMMRWLGALGSWLRGRTVTEGAFTSGRFRGVVNEWARRTPFTGVLISSSALASYLRLPALRDVPKVIDLIDVDSQKWFDYSAASRWPRSWIYRSEGSRLRRLEQTLPGWVRGVLLVSDAEADLYRGFCTPGTVRTVTNGVDLDYFTPADQSEPEPACVFVGALDYRPNVDAACWFSTIVWPQIRARRPDARLRLVGRRPAAEVQRLAAIPGVEVIGQVADVRPHVARAAVAVVPLRIARGLQNKVLEAMAMAKPVVSSPQALAGLGNGQPPPVWTASTPKQWADHVLRLLDETALRQALGQAGRRYVEEHHRWERCLEPLGPLLGLTDRARSPAVARV